MTAEALSPPNPVESLRERLIRTGEIIPAALQERIDKIENSINKFTLVGNLGRSFFSKINSILNIVSRSFSALSSAFKLLALNLAERKIQKLIFPCDKCFSKFNKGFQIVRQSFFFAFKVDKRNTP
jgi:hypothetical protein